MLLMVGLAVATEGVGLDVDGVGDEEVVEVEDNMFEPVVLS